ncbi:hypothetical protein GCM10027586_18110 [Kineococcus gypseus]
MPQESSTPAGPVVEFGPLSAAVLRLARAHRALASQLMREVGLRPEQGALMMHLWTAGPVRQTHLAARFGKDSAATSRTVQRLEAAGYVRRRTDPTDGRATLVEPTAAGDALRAHVERLWTRLEDAVARGLGEHEREVAQDLLDRLGDALLEQLDAEAARSLEEI